MAVDPATLKVVAKIVTTAASDERIRRVILIACLIPFLLILLVLSSPFAIFFSMTSDGHKDDAISITETLYGLRESFEEKVKIEENDNSMDEIHTVIMGSEDNSIIDNSIDVLITFAVKYNVIDDEAEQVALLKKKQINKLRKVFWAMNTISIKIDTVTEEKMYTTTNDKGKSVTKTKTVTKKIKTIYVDCLTLEDGASLYSFNKKQLKVAREMQKSGIGILQNHNVNMFLTRSQIDTIKAYLPENLTIDRVDVVSKAKSIVGKVHYFWGGKSNAINWDNRWGTQMEVTSVGSTSTGTKRAFGLDCSGYVTWVFINMGLDIDSIDKTIGHGTTKQWNLSTSIIESAVLPGDLAFLAVPGTRKVNHIGIVVGKDDEGSILVAHCASGPNNVVITKAESTGFIYFRRSAILIE